MDGLRMNFYTIMIILALLNLMMILFESVFESSGIIS